MVAAGFETLLRIEGRFDVQRAASLSDASVFAAQWRADVALVDGLLLQNGERGELGVPAYVLSGSEADGLALAGHLDRPAGWLRKDATARELADAVDRAVPLPLARRRAASGVALVVALVAALAALVWWGWLALARAG